MKKSFLQEIGLTKSESEIYLTLLKLGKCSVKQIAANTNIQRPNIYDALEKLKEKGLVTSITENKVQLFNALPPSKLKEYLKEKEALIIENIPKLEEIYNKVQMDIKVDLFKGKEGVKHLLNDIIFVGKDYHCIGLDDDDWENLLSVFIKQHFRREKEIGIKGYGLTKESSTFNYKETVYKKLPDKYFPESSTLIYGNKVGMVIWNPLSVIIIENESFAKAQKKQFDKLWSIAK